MQGRFRKHALAVAIALACPTLALQAAPDRPGLFDKPAAEMAEPQRYLVKLQRDADFDAVLAQAVDGARFERRSRLVPEYFWVTLSPEAAAAMKARPGVERVVPDVIGTHAQKIEMQAMAASTKNVSSSEIPPLSDDPEAGKGVRVAVVSTGMDYTHAALGGPGTIEAYEEALANRAALYDGFPTTVVVSGFDANSEDAEFDLNPIENAVPDVDRTLFPSYPFGRGTLLGSVVHEHAPGAELLAYKIYSAQSDGRGNFFASYPNAESLDRAFTHLADPNGDGDYSDRADIALIDTAGGLAFYNPYDQSESGDSMLINFIQALAAKGVLVVTDTGTFGPQSRYTISWIGAAPDALTVGAMNELEDGSHVAASFSARGPVRGPTGTMKPDLVSYGFDIIGAAVGTGSETVTETSNNVAAARITAAAAILKSERPELSALDLKTLLANTAIHDVLGRDEAGTVEPDVTYIGLGRENLAAATSANALVRSEGNNQPSVNFGFQEFDKPGRLTRRLVVRNLSGEDQSFALSHVMNGDKPNHDAISLEYPATVYVPANRQVTIDVAVNVDPAKLQPWPLRSTEDYTDANWRAVQLNGYLTFMQMAGNDAAASEMSVAWMITPRAKIEIERDFSSVKELIQRWGEDPPPELALGDGFVEYGATGYTMDFTNSGVASATFAALPMIVRQEEILPHLKNSGGHMLRYVSGGVFDEPACPVTGQKLVIAATMHRPAEVASANYFDKVSDVLFTYSMIREQTVIDWGLDQSIDQDDLIFMGDEDYVTHSWVTVNSDGKPVTIYIDLNVPYDPSNPSGRYRESTLPTYFSAHSRNVMSQVCVEDILHHRMTPEELNKNVGLVIGTDRMTLPEQFTPVIQFNPVRYGYLYKECWDGDCWVNYNDGAKVTMEIAPGAETPAFNPVLMVAPGERVKVTAVKEDACDGFSFFGPPPPCNRRFVLMGLEGDFVIGAKVASGGDETVTPFVQEGQEFTVTEHAEAGTVIGRVLLDSEGFFAIGVDPDSPWFDYVIYLNNSLPGNPLAVQPNGDIVVVNPDALDYELTDSLSLHVRARDGYDTSRVAEVVVRLTNVNDVAPAYSGGLNDLSFAHDASISVDIAGHFSDEEGDSLTFTVDGLPSGVSYDAQSGAISGTPTESGTFNVSVTASDGAHETTAAFELTVEAKPKVFGGGSLGFWFLVALLLVRFTPPISKRS